MANHYIDSSEAHAQAKRRRDFCTLIRNYYNGRPYRDPFQPYALDDQGNEIIVPDQNTYLWQQFLCPTDPEELSDIPVYIDNLVREALDMLMLEMLPDDMELMLVGAKQQIRDLSGFLEPMLSFGEQYSRDIAGCMNWSRDLALEIAKAGEGLPIIRYLPDDTALTWDFAATEYFTVELHPITNKPVFYRFEFQYPTMVDGAMTPLVLQSEYYREDIYPREIQRYKGKALPSPALLPPMGGRLFSEAIYAYSGNKPIEFHRIEDDDEELRGVVEREIYGRLGHGPAWHFMWHTENFGEQRGVSEIQINQLRALDSINRLGMSWADSAHNTGNPPLGGINFNPPGSDDKRTIFASGSSSISGRRGLHKQDGFAPGSSWTANAKTGEDFYFGYPQNQPSVPPYDDCIKWLQAAFFGVNVNARQDPSQISHVGQMSGYAANEYKKLHNQYVQKYRSRFISKLTEMLNYGLRMCDQLGLIRLPAAADEDRVRLEIRFGRANLTPDEEMKLVTTNRMMMDAGFPVRQLGADRWPARGTDWEEIYQGLEQVQELTIEALELAANPPMPAPAAGGQGANRSGAASRVMSRVQRTVSSNSGTDNNAK